MRRRMSKEFDRGERLFLFGSLGRGLVGSNETLSLGLAAQCQVPSSMMTSSTPGCRWCASRIALGMTICPLLDILTVSTLGLGLVRRIGKMDGSPMPGEVSIARKAPADHPHTTALVGFVTVMDVLAVVVKTEALSVACLVIPVSPRRERDCGRHQARLWV